MDLNTAIKQLELAFLETPEFAELKNARAVIEKSKRTKDIMEQFSRKQETLYSGNLPQNRLQALMDEIDTDYERLSTIPEIRRYFEAVDSLNYLLTKVMKDVNVSIEEKLK